MMGALRNRRKDRLWFALAALGAVVVSFGSLVGLRIAPRPAAPPPPPATWGPALAAVGTQVTHPSYGDLWRDCRDLGIRASNSGSANSTAIEAFLAAQPDLSNTGQFIVISFPANLGSYAFARPINPDRGNLRFVGTGGTAKLQIEGRPDPVFALGFGLRPAGVALSSDHFFSLSGKLDGSVGTRYGLRLKGDSHVAQGSGPFAVGAPPASGQHAGYWGDVRQLTIEVALDFTSIAQTSRPIGGIDGVWQIWIDGSPSTWQFRFYGPVPSPGVAKPIHSIAISGIPTTAGVRKVALQVDLDTREVVGFADGVQRTTTATWGVAGGATVNLAANQGKPYLIGSLGTLATSSDWWSNGTHYDLAVCGHAIYKALRYANDGVGQPQRRIDSGTLDDLYRYFSTTDTGLVAALPLTDAPSNAARRLVTVMGATTSWNRYGSALFLSLEHANNWIGPFAFEDLIIKGDTGSVDQQVYGDAVLFGNALNCDFRRCDIRGGSRGIGSWGGGASYVHRAEDCTLGGAEAAFYATLATWHMRNIDVPAPGRNAIWSYLTRLRLDGFATGDDPSARCERVIYAQGGNVEARNGQLDLESGGTPTRCYVECQTSTGLGVDLTGASFEDIALGSLADGQSYWVLGQLDSAVPCRIRVARVGPIFDSKEALVRVDHSGWFGEVDIDYTGLTTPAVLKNYVGAATKVVQVGPLAP